MGYQVSDETQLNQYLATINRLLEQKGRGPLHVDAIRGGDAQLKVMVDLLHLYGMAVVFDVVYNHGGGFGGFGGIPEDREAIFFWDRQKRGDNNRSLYFTDQTYSGGLGFALFKQPVSDFLLHNALDLLSEFHIDGLRYDEISQLLDLNAHTGADFCRRITAACRASRPDAIHNAEFWPSESNLVSAFDVVNDATHGGLDFDVRQADGLRSAVRVAIGGAANGRDADVNMDSIAFQIQNVSDFRNKWRAGPCVENHDIVYKDRDLRVARLADQSNARSWYARSRSRVATGLLLTAPGFPSCSWARSSSRTNSPDDGRGRWREMFNSDVYDNWVNPIVAGNGGQIFANGPCAQGLPFSASIVIPGNGLLVFAREN